MLAGLLCNVVNPGDAILGVLARLNRLRPAIDKAGTSRAVQVRNVNWHHKTPRQSATRVPSVGLDFNPVAERGQMASLVQRKTHFAARNLVVGARLHQRAIRDEGAAAMRVWT